jgi:hypothetical protein
MKRIVLITTAVLAIGATASAQLPPRGSIGLYADGARSYNASCTIPPGFAIAKVEVWIWCLPGENGLEGTEFAVGYPSNVIRDRVTYNGSLSTIGGDLISGLSAHFDACQWTWVWVAHQALYVSSVQQTYLEVVPHPVSSVFQYFICADGNPAEPCLKGTSLMLNAAAPCLPPETAIDVEGPSWGTLKSLFTE